MPAIERGGMRVHRARVDALVEQACTHRICVVTGVAGWGKTSAVRSWTQERTTAWLRAGDAVDAHWLAERLVAALPGELSPATRPPELPESTSPAAAAACGELICRWLADVLHAPLVVVFDDLWQLGPGSAAAGLVEALCWHAPEALRLVLISRGTLPFPLASLRQQDWVGELDAPRLAFTAPEITTVLGGLTPDTAGRLAERLTARTAGWPAAVSRVADRLLAVEPGERAGQLDQILDELTGPGGQLHNYLVDEVISAETAPVQQLLRRLAVFDQLPAELVAPEHEDPARALADLTRRGLATRSADAGLRWSLIPPLAECFRYDGVLPAAERTALHRTAAAQRRDRGEHAAALRHLLAAGTHSDAAELLLEHGCAMVSSGDASTVASATALPAEHLADPRIQWLLGHAAMVVGRWAEATEHLRRAGAGQDGLQPPIAWALGLIAFGRGEFDEIIALTERASFGQEDTASEARLLALAAQAHRITGDLDGARRLLRRAAGAARRCDRAQAHAEVDLASAMLAAADNDRRLAEVHYASAFEHARAGGAELEIAQIHVSRAFHLLDLGAPREALGEAQAALRCGRGCSAPLLIAHALTVQARANQRLGELDAALTGFTEAVAVLRPLGSRFQSWPLAGLGDVYRIKGQLTRARAAYEEALALAEPCRDRYGMSWALSGLARVRATDDLTVARTLADRAVALGEELHAVPALLTRGWITLLAGDRDTASGDAMRAATQARRLCDDVGAAEAIALGVLASRRPDTDRLVEVVDIWRDTGCRLEEAVARMVAAQIGAPVPGSGASLARQTLLASGVEIARPRAAGPLAVLARRLPSVAIRALGAFQVLRDSAPVPKTEWQSKKARDLLKMLVAIRRPVPRERLMELLWPGVDPSRAGNRLSVLLSMVRDILRPARAGECEEGALGSDSALVWLDRSQVTVDVEDFLGTANDSLAAHRAASDDAVTLLEAAARAHTGDFLAGDPYVEWAEPLAEEVRATHIAVLRALAVRQHLAGEVDAAVRTTLRLLGEDPYDETAHLDLVGMLLGVGRLGEARRHYRNYSRRMAEIDVPPRPMPGLRRIGSAVSANRSG